MLTELSRTGHRVRAGHADHDVAGVPVVTARLLREVAGQHTTDTWAAVRAVAAPFPLLYQLIVSKDSDTVRLN